MAISLGLVAAGLTTAAATPAGAAAGTPAPASASAVSTGWTVYHGSPIGSGHYGASINLSNAHLAWTSPTLTGQLYGEPLISGQLVFVATTADVVYALRAADGTVAWSTTVGVPVPSGDLPCGDISPTVGVVGTPVIDAARHELFAVADEVVNGSPAHHLVGIDATTGKVVLDQNVDPPGSYPPALLQRTGLNLTSGRVVFAYGGNSGDCSTYHGWVVSVPETGGAAARFELDAPAGASQGAVWMGGAAPVVDGSGNVWVASGNGSTTSGSPDNADSVLELSPTMKRLQVFTPSTWASDNENDADLGSAAPAVLPDGHVVQVGKSETAYVLNRKHLGGIGGQQAQVHPICGATFDGGDAFVGSTVFLPCQNGPLAVTVKTNPAGLTVDWTTAISQAGPPILAGGSVWTIDQQGALDALDPSTGAVTQQLEIGPVANHFPTPAVGDGLLLAPAASTVTAFAG